MDLHKAKQAATALLAEIRQGRSLLRLGQRILTDRRFQLGQILRRVRERFPVSGKGAAGWGKFCRELDLKRTTAVRYIEIAAQVEARPEMAERRSFLDVYLELGLALPPPAGRSAAAAAVAAAAAAAAAQDVANEATFAAAAAADVASGGTSDERPDLFEEEDDEGKAPQGRPPLSERERRDDIYTVRLNTEETLRLRHLSGLLVLCDAEVFREGLLALEEREKNKVALLGPRPAPAAVRKAR